MLSRRVVGILGSVFGRGTADFGSGDLEAASDQARNALVAATRNSTRVLWLAAGMLTVLFVAMIWLLIQFSDQPAAFTAVAGAAGVTFAGLIKLMISIAREQTQASVLAELSLRLPPQDVQAMMLALLRAEKVGNAPDGKGEK